MTPVDEMVWPSENGTGYVDLNAPQCYVVHALPVSFFLTVTEPVSGSSIFLFIALVCSINAGYIFPELLVMFFP